MEGHPPPRTHPKRKESDLNQENRLGQGTKPESSVRRDRSESSLLYFHVGLSPSLCWSHSAECWEARGERLPSRLQETRARSGAGGRKGSPWVLGHPDTLSPWWHVGDSLNMREKLPGFSPN